MAWRATARGGASSGRSAPSTTPRAKPTMQAIAQIEKNREDRRRAMAAAKREREKESLLNEKLGHPGDVDFQRMIKAFREQNGEKARPHAAADDTKITICVRKRPVNCKEVKKHDYDAVTCLNPMAIVHDCKLKVDGITKYLDSNAFNFDHTFDENATNESVYLHTAQPLVKFVFQDRGHATVFAYGQTGSGKTHTMQGIQKQIAADVFAQADEFHQRGTPLDVCVSFFEIYGGRCQDLLHRQVLTIREDGNGEVQIVDLEEVQPQTTEELLQVISKGNSLRTTHATEVNDVSSRSHCICQINLREKGTGQLHGKLSLIDLAGSERGEDTKNHNRQRRMESAEINRSLLALKECFRTVMIAAVSPCASSSDHTLNTLRYADRVKEKRVSADAFGDGNAESEVVDVEDVQFEEDLDDDGNSSDELEEYKDEEEDQPNDGEDDDSMDEEEEEEDADMPDGDRSDVVTISTHHRNVGPALSDDLSVLRISLRRHSSELRSLMCPVLVQTLYEEQESLLNTHMTAIQVRQLSRWMCLRLCLILSGALTQESAELLTEEGAMLATIQDDVSGDAAKMEQYVSRLEDHGMKTSRLAAALLSRGQLAARGKHTWRAAAGSASQCLDAVSLAQTAATNTKARCLSTAAAAESSHGSDVVRVAAVLGAATAAIGVGLGFSEARTEAASDKKEEKRFEYAEAVDTIREQVSEFRATLKSSETRIPKAFPIKKIGISRIHAPNGVSTIRIEFACPSFVDQEAILGRFLLHLQQASVSGARQAVEVLPVPLDRAAKKSIVESYEQPAVNYLYANGAGSFQFLRDTSSMQTMCKFVFYKDEFLTQSEIDAIVAAYKELYSYANVNAFFRHELEQRRKNAIVGRGRNPTTNAAVASDSKEEAIQQLQGLGIEVFEPLQTENSLNWDSLVRWLALPARSIEDTVVLALQNPELYERIAQKTRCRYESNRPRAVLFEGPPGTGKTLSARIIAQQAGIPMVHIPIESVVSKWYGDSEKKMSSIFDACEKLDGAIIFIDEVRMAYAKQLSGEELSQLAAVSPQLSCRDIKEICEYAERKWASKVLKKEEMAELPTLRTYMDAVKAHMGGLAGHDAQPNIYEA
ncbi:hypothetical protein BBJ28_00010477 [Nothophytophthora sp. Chile5]|nr:hypothetical protein BBJ28_00010477 [Nothophytophthora sp. Chile5]